MKAIIAIAIIVTLSAVVLICLTWNKPVQKQTQGVWSELNVIDAHAHIGTFANFDLSTPTLLSNVETYGVKLALISNIDGSNLPGTTENLDEKTANEVTAQTVREHPDIFRGLLWTRPADGDETLLEPFLKNCKDGKGKNIFVGLKFHPEFNQLEADDPRLDPYLELCEKYRLPAAFHSGSANSKSDPLRIYNLGKRFPKVPIVLYHMGFNGDHMRAINVAKQAKEQGDAILYLETAQADPESVIKAINEVGSKYVLFGTDATYFGKSHYSQYQAQIDLLKKQLSKKDLDNVLHKNAKRIFRL